MRNRKILMLILVLFVMVSFSDGCSKSNNASSPSPSESPTESPTEISSESSSPSSSESSSPAAEKITVDIFQYQKDYNDPLNEAVKEYSKENENIEINIETVKEGQDYNAALRAKFNSNMAPAIFNIRGPGDIAEWKPKLADLSGMELVKNTFEGYLDAVKVEGKVYGLPYFVQGYGIIYNTKIFEEAQVDIKNISTYDAFENLVKDLDKKKKELKIDAVFALPAKEKDYLGLFLSNTFIAPEFDNSVVKTFEARALEFKYQDELKKMLDLQNKYSVQPSIGIDYQSQVDYLFSTGKVAMIPQGNWAYESIELIDKNLAKTGMEFLPFPIKGVKEDANPVGVPMYWAINKSKQEDVQKAAKDFLNWFYLSDAGKKVIKERFKFISAYMGNSADSVADPLSKHILNQASAGKTIGWVFNGYPPGWAEKLAADLQQYLQNKLSWEEVVKKAKTSWVDERK